MKIMKYFFAMGIYFCVGTIIAQAVGLTLLWKQGALSEEKMFRLVALVQDVDVDAIKREIEEKNKSPDAAQLAFDDIQKKRAEMNLNLDLKSASVVKGKNELRQLWAELQGKWDQYDNLSKSFKKELKQQQGTVIEIGRQRVVQILQMAKAKQAKDQIIRILLEDSGPDSQAMADVVRIFKVAQPDKLKKIISEFKTEEEKNQLHEILRHIRLGEPEISLIRNTQEKLPGK